MNNFAAITSLSLALALQAAAQLSPLPPPASIDGIPIQGGESNPNTPAWRASALVDYRVATDYAFNLPPPGRPDLYGRTWTNQSPGRNELNARAGTLRLIFLGPTEQWQNAALGYTYSGSPLSNAFTLSSDLSAHQFARYVDMPLAIGQAAQFDFWFSTPAGTATLFEPNNSLPSTPGLSVSWTAAPFLVSTHLDALGTFADTETWVVNIADSTVQTRSSPPSYRLAVQFFYNEMGGGTPPGSAVPEPSTYGLFATLALGALAAWRRTRSPAAKAR